MTASTGVGRGNHGTGDLHVIPYRAHPDGPKMIRAALPRALALVNNVRHEGVDGVARILDPLTWEETAAVVVMLAAMVPDDVPVSTLTAWINDPPRQEEAS